MLPFGAQWFAEVAFSCYYTSFASMTAKSGQSGLQAD
jgi:hypothetical protein